MSGCPSRLVLRCVHGVAVHGLDAREDHARVCWSQPLGGIPVHHVSSPPVAGL